jgi:hypothetical protein
MLLAIVVNEMAIIVVDCSFITFMLNVMKVHKVLQELEWKKKHGMVQS